MKWSTNNYVLKFVGGDRLKRTCVFCKKATLRSVLCVYGNCGKGDDGVFVCRRCIKRGLDLSESGWKRILAASRKVRKVRNPRG